MAHKGEIKKAEVDIVNKFHKEILAAVGKPECSQLVKDYSEFVSATKGHKDLEDCYPYEGQTTPKTETPQ